MAYKSFEDILNDVYDATNKALKIKVTALDDQPINLGTGSTVKILYETADANANALIFVAPEGGATDVPAFIFGDASIDNADLGWFNGVTEPTIAVVNDAKDAYATLDAGDDAVAGSKGLYFKAAADEDIELINLSVTGTPRIYWDESEDLVRFTKGIYLEAGLTIKAAVSDVSIILHGNSSDNVSLALGKTIGTTDFIVGEAFGGTLRIGSGTGIASVTGLEIGATGLIGFGTAPYAAQVTGSIGVAGGVMIGASSTNNLFDDATNGAASATMYIGNASINVTSDIRVKENIRLWDGDALDLLNKFRVVEFDYLAQYRPFGGIYSDKYVGMTAQEIYQLAPWVVNTQGGKDCPDCLLGRACSEHPPWQVNHELLAGVLIKAIQELRQKIEVLRG